MAINRDRSFDIGENGLLFEGAAHLSSGNSNPNHTANAGDWYFNISDSTLWRYVNSQWELFSSKKIFSPQFQFIGLMNFDQYLYSYGHHADLFTRRSGDASNGYRFSNSAPINCEITGNVYEAIANITGIAQSTGSPAAELELLFELWNVGFSNEGTKLGDIVFTVDTSTYSVGNFWNASGNTAYSEIQNQDVDVTKGDLLGLKFIRQTGSDKVVAIDNATITLIIEES